MDPICHTLVGAAIATTGLEKKTRYGRATLLIAANLPDIDACAFLAGQTQMYAFRRGITHGLPALVVLPFLLAGLFWAWNRWRPPPKSGPPASFRWLLILSAIGIASHPALDCLNTYGMRWLMPFSDQWFYGDTLFVIDWIAWGVLAVGLLATRFITRGKVGRSSVICLLVFGAYVGLNFAITKTAESVVREALVDSPPQSLMASPVVLNPLRRDIVLEYPDRYRFGAYVPGRTPSFQLDDRVIEKGDPRDFERARERVEGRRFLYWARFPYVQSNTVNGVTTILLADARYVPDLENRRFAGFAVITLRLENLGD